MNYLRRSWICWASGAARNRLRGRKVTRENRFRAANKLLDKAGTKSKLIVTTKLAESPIVVRGNKRECNRTHSSTAVIVFFVVFAASAHGGDRISFNEQIRPLLSDRCLACHGPDEKHREADLRLDIRADAVGTADSPRGIIVGKPEQSPLWQRIISTDPDSQMPPPAAKKPRFTVEELALLRRWIEEGAEYEGHWAFLPLRDEPPPATVGAPHPIDAFVYRKLVTKGIKPSIEAERTTLIRRVTLDLIGLLPSPDEVSEFVNDKSPTAYERLVDRLLASPHYGERWGRHWLDQARYADSNGYAIDAPREMWPYRDWVIEALNRDQPFDQFTIDQLAGDLLAQPTKHQLIATGFHRNTLINQEGGTDREQFRVEAAMDRANTTGAVWMGLTVGCAQCHSHKFDPISQREYYQLFAFFNSAQDANDRGPTVEVVRGEVFGQPVSVPRDPPAPTAAELAKLRSDWEDTTRSRLEQVHKESSSKPVEWSPVAYVETRTASGATFTKLKDGSLLSSPMSTPHETYHLTLTSALAQIAAVRLRTLTHESLPKQGPGRAGNGNFVLTAFTLTANGQNQPFARATADHEQLDFSVEGLIDADPKSGWAINVGPGSMAKMNSDHEATFVLAKPLIPDGKPFEIVMRHDLNANYLVGRFAIEVSAATPTTVSTHDAALLVVLQKPAGDRSKDEAARLQQAFEKAEPRARKVEKKTNPNLAQAMVMRDLPQHRETFLLTRGDFTRPNKELGTLTPGVIAAVAPALGVQAAQPNRLDLARWLVHPDNSLTSRVTSNRVWMRYFGRGLVETDEDFGAQGASPTHSDLLDWLSREFQHRGWSQKSLHRLIVTSATYKQSSRLRPDLVVSDPRNLWLARQERFRLEGESARDAALVASGLLESTLGGPSVHPPQPDGVYAFTQVNKSWPTEQDRQRYRRTLYTFFYRSAPYPLFTTFDAPDFQAVCTRRLRSNTPLQALTLANDSAFFELAQGLALRLATERRGEFAAVLDDRINLAALTCFSRPPNADEAKLLRDYVGQQVLSFREDAAAAKSLTTPALRQILDAPEAASLVLLARTLFNADNFITRE